MKRRMNVVLDDELVEKARKVMGEKTYSGAITKALEKVVKQEDFWDKLEEWQKLANEGGMFVEGHLESVRPPEYSMDYVLPKRRSANEVRAPRVSKKKRHASR